MNAELLDDLKNVIAKHDENHLTLTCPALSVLAATLSALDQTDEYWGQNEKAGVPSETDYAAIVISHLQKHYSTPGVRL